MKQLVINPGSTSTKIGIFEDLDLIYEKTLRHSEKDLESYKDIIEQLDFRKEIIEEAMKEIGIKKNQLDAVVGRGGLLKPMEGGTYNINIRMLEDLKEAKMGEHASNLGALLAYEISNEIGIPGFIVDPVVVDEMEELSRISGHPRFERLSIFHALNQKAVARKSAEQLNKKYEEVNLIVVHLGGGISVGAHKKGKVVDVNNALDGDGPFTPERSGTLPLTGFMKLCFSGEYELADVKKMLKGKGGLVSYLDTNDAQEVQSMVKNGNKKAEVVYKALAYQISKWIGKMSTAMDFEVDAIALTGGVAYDQNMIDKWIKERVEFIAPIYIFPGGDEERALAMSAYRALKGEQNIKTY